MRPDVSQPSIQSLIELGALRTYFQPIVSVRRKAVVGVEALMRAVNPANGALLLPKNLLESAASQNFTAALDRATRNLALKSFASRAIPRDTMLFLNVDLQSISEGQNVSELLHLTRALDIPPESIVLELVESQFDDVDLLNRFITRVREHGMLIAVDDIGAGHSNLERISLIKPNILKIDRSLCSMLGKDYCTEEVFSSLANLGRRIGAVVVAEGIETREQAVIAMERGADLLQGYLIRKPCRAEDMDISTVQNTTHGLAGYYRQHMVNSLNNRKIERRTHNILLDTILSQMSLIDVSVFSTALARMIRDRHDIECAYVLDHRGEQVTETIFASSEMATQSPMFKPAEKGADHSLKGYYHAILDNETNRFVTEPYVSVASGQLCRTLSSVFRDGSNERIYVLCIDVKAAERV